MLARLVLFAGMLADPAVGSAEEAEVISLVGPERVEVGRSVTIRVNEPAACVWQVQPMGTTWVSGRNDDGSFVVLLDLPAGRYFVSCVSFEKKLHATMSVEVETPPGPPSPPVPPAPPPPPSRFGLTKEVAEWMRKEVPRDASSMSLALARSFRSMQSAIAAGTLREPAVILKETLASNNRALGAHVEGWRSWGSRLEARLSELHRSGLLRTAADYGEAWGEIALGLEQARDIEPSNGAASGSEGKR